MITKQQLIDKLNDDLGNEYAHWNFYIHATTNVTGLHREELSEFFLKEAAGEMKHIEEFKRLIIGLGGVPNAVTNQFVHNLTDAKQILMEALSFEDQVVHNYVYRIDEAQELQENGGQDKVDGKYIELFLEEQILDSRADADHIREMVKNC